MNNWKLPNRAAGVAIIHPDYPIIALVHSANQLYPVDMCLSSNFIYIEDYGYKYVTIHNQVISKSFLSNGTTSEMRDTLHQKLPTKFLPTKLNGENARGNRFQHADKFTDHLPVTMTTRMDVKNIVNDRKYLYTNDNKEIHKDDVELLDCNAENKINNGGNIFKQVDVCQKANSDVKHHKQARIKYTVPRTSVYKPWVGNKRMATEDLIRPRSPLHYDKDASISTDKAEETFETLNVTPKKQTHDDTTEIAADNKNSASTVDVQCTGSNVDYSKEKVNDDVEVEKSSDANDRSNASNNDFAAYNSKNKRPLDVVL